MRPHFLGGPPQHQTFGQAPSPQNNANYMAANGPRFQNFPRLQQSHPGAMSGPQGPQPPSMRPIMQNVSNLLFSIFLQESLQNFTRADIYLSGINLFIFL